MSIVDYFPCADLEPNPSTQIPSLRPTLSKSNVVAVHKAPEAIVSKVPLELPRARIYNARVRRVDSSKLRVQDVWVSDSR